MKGWVADIQEHVQVWSERLRPVNRQWWPRFVYHYTDVQNAVNILKTGHIYSRTEATRRQLMKTENASLEVISHTIEAHRQFARLYFRPRTPTQYHNEGIRPPSRRFHPNMPGAHCPVPVFFCFDAVSVLSRDDTSFSNGNMGSSYVQYDDSIEFFKQIPFAYVYHQGSLGQEEKSTVVFHRHAEVLVPTALPLQPAIRFLACRSVAERQMLLHLLPSNLEREWSEHVRLGIDGLFERSWTYIESVTTVNDRITFKFNPNTSMPGPFSMKFEYIEDGNKKPRKWEGLSNELNRPFSIRLSGAVRGEARLYLDDCLAFAGRIDFDEIPF